jgi:SAM-dependent methyltransferase
MDGKLIAYCDGGLGNRLNALIGALYFARRLRLEPVISWPINRWCAAPFEDLFEAPYPVDRRSMPEIDAAHRRHVLLTHERQAFTMPVAFDPGRVLWPGALLAELEHALANAEGLIYSNSLVPGYVSRREAQAMARTLRVKREYRDLADEFLGGAGLLNRSYWGLHLRGTDAGFPTGYYDRWYRITRVLPGPIVLCTDDKAVEERFLRNPAIVRRSTSALPRKAKEGQGWNSAQRDEYGREFPFNIFRDADAVRESMIDFEILARSRALRTSGSTFLENALRFSDRAPLFQWLHDRRAWLRYAHSVLKARRIRCDCSAPAADTMADQSKGAAMRFAVARRLVSNTLALLPQRHRMMVDRLVKRVIPGKRHGLAAKYLRGSGIEVGAMHNPLRLPEGVSVRYVDYVSRDHNIERFTELKGFQMVAPDFIEDGFTLPSFQQSSVDFLIANHVLEHTDNALKTLMRWAEVLRPGGVLFLSVPLAERCFDRGRAITTLEHFISDYELERSARTDSLREHTREHYVEWVSISDPAIIVERGGKVIPQSSQDLGKRADELLAQQAEIHFHTFTIASYEDLLRHFCTHMRPDFHVLDIVENGIEVIGVLQRD